MRTRTVLGSLFVAWATVAGTAFASEDLIAPIPTGWSAIPYWFAASSQDVAVALRPVAGDPFTTGTRVMMVKPTGTLLAELPGKVSFAEYDRQGAYLLVHHQGPDGPKVSLLSGTSGNILWTKTNDPRLFAFSATGAVIYVRQVANEWSSGGNEIEILSLAGASLRRFVVDKGYRDATVPDDGTRVVLALGGSIISFRVEDGLVREWSIDPTASDTPIVGFRTLDVGHFLVLREFGQFDVIRSDGTREYKFDPSALSRRDSSRSVDAFAAYQPSNSPHHDNLLLYNGSNEAILLKPSTGTLTGKRLNGSVPKGFQLVPMVGASKLVFYSEGALRIRSIPSE